MKKVTKYPEGYWLNIGIAIGIALGIIIDLAISDVLIGIGIGVVLGVTIGGLLEQQQKSKIRPLTIKEKKTMKSLAKIVFILLLLSFIIGFFIFFSMFIK